jgi:hypothetical protein
MLTGVDRYRDHALIQPLATASKKEEPYIDLPYDTLQELIKCPQEGDQTAKEAWQAVALPRRRVTKRQGANKVNNYRDISEDIEGLLYQK